MTVQLVVNNEPLETRESSAFGRKNSLYNSNSAAAGGWGFGAGWGTGAASGPSGGRAVRAAEVRTAISEKTVADKTLADKTVGPTTTMFFGFACIVRPIYSAASIESLPQFSTALVSTSLVLAQY